MLWKVYGQVEEERHTKKRFAAFLGHTPTQRQWYQRGHSLSIAWLLVTTLPTLTATFNYHVTGNSLNANALVLSLSSHS